ncbi:MAG: DUF427 domain-containing protein [Geminicoccaceae bacterium]
MTHSEITLATQTIHDPDEPRHFMRLKPVDKRVVISFRGEVVAESTDALRLLEVGRDLYDPVFYLPEQDTSKSLRPGDHTTHCPLKGDTVYFDLTDGAGGVRQANIAWSYAKPFDFAAELAGRIAFDSRYVAIQEMPVDEAPIGTETAS